MREYNIQIIILIICSILTTTLSAIKVIGNYNWSWWVIFLPLLAPFVLLIILFLLYMLLIWYWIYKEGYKHLPKY